MAPRVNFGPGMFVASLICGSIGAGLAVYGKRQRSTPQMVGGAIIFVSGFFLETALSLYLVTAASVAVTWWLARNEE